MIKEKYPLKMKCIHCRGMAILMDLWEIEIEYKKFKQDKFRFYYYHYSRNYDLGCHQRTSVNTNRMNELTEWTWWDELKNKVRNKKWNWNNLW